jgi:hypothetical protein
MFRISSFVMALALILSGTTPAHAGWLAKARKVGKKLFQRNPSSNPEAREARQSADERNVRRQQVVKQVVSASQRPMAQQIGQGFGTAPRPINLGELLGGSRRNSAHVSSVHQMLVRNGGATQTAPVFGFRNSNFDPVFTNATTRATGTSLPLFNFSM